VKRPEVRFRLDKKQLVEIAKTQMEILNFASTLVNNGGKIFYSTCSILNKENSEIIAQFLAQKKEFKLIEEKLFLPRAGNIDCDGGFAAILEKK
jgi:16S rRNA (cytosine967-C5)-methyltransferase